MAAYQHGGDIYRHQIELDFSVNVNPLGIPAQVQQTFLDSLAELTHYPDSETEALRQALADFHKLPKDFILCGNGCADLIFQLIAAVKPKRAVVPAPTFGEYEAALRMSDCEVIPFYLKREEGFTLNIEALKQFLERESLNGRIDMLFLCNPNNPTGLAVSSGNLHPLVQTCRKLGILLTADECFTEFMEAHEQYSLIDWVKDETGLFILKAFTKTYALAGLRLGYGLCSDVQRLARMKAGRQPWSVSIPAQKAGTAALSVSGFMEQTRTFLAAERLWLSEELRQLGFLVYPSRVNYLFFENKWERTAALDTWCRGHGILIRNCENYRGLATGDYRICIRQREDNRRLLAVLKAYLCFVSRPDPDGLSYCSDIVP